jgi:hypothetical protein
MLVDKVFFFKDLEIDFTYSHGFLLDIDNTALAETYLFA